MVCKGDVVADGASTRVDDKNKRKTGIKTHGYVAYNVSVEGKNT